MALKCPVGSLVKSTAAFNFGAVSAFSAQVWYQPNSNSTAPNYPIIFGGFTRLPFSFLPNAAGYDLVTLSASAGE